MTVYLHWQSTVTEKRICRLRIRNPKRSKLLSRKNRLVAQFLEFTQQHAELVFAIRLCDHKYKKGRDRGRSSAFEQRFAILKSKALTEF